MEDVIIVGGGPTGFTTALGLARAGVTVRIIEAEAEIVAAPRAPIFHWVVLDGLERLGVLDDCIAAGFVKNDIDWLVHTTGERIGWDMSVLDGKVRHPYQMHLGQHRMAGVVRDHLARLGNATIAFDTRCTGLAQDADGVTVFTDGANGPAEHRARWVIGTDGAGSAVRKAIGAAFEGTTWDERFVATNLRYDFTRLGFGRSQMIIDADCGAVIALISKNGLWRCTYMEDAALPVENYLDRMPAFFAKILPDPEAVVVDASSPYRMHQRSADRYRVGRVLLAGDAAHATNPTGALGLTSGLFDAYALTPALTAVILEGADDEVLDRYAEARRAMFVDRVSPQASMNKRLIYHANGGGPALQAALANHRRMQDDLDFRLQRMMGMRGLETPSLLDARPAQPAEAR